MAWKDTLVEELARLGGEAGCRKNPADPQVFGLTTLGGRGVGWTSMAVREPGGGRMGTGL